MIIFVGDSPYPNTDLLYTSTDAMYVPDKQVAFVTSIMPDSRSKSLANLLSIWDFKLEDFKTSDDIYNLFKKNEIYLYNAFDKKGDKQLSKKFVEKINKYGCKCDTFVIFGLQAWNSLGEISKFSESNFCLVPHPGRDTKLFKEWIKGREDERFTSMKVLKWRISLKCVDSYK